MKQGTATHSARADRRHAGMKAAVEAAVSSALTEVGAPSDLLETTVIYPANSGRATVVVIQPLPVRDRLGAVASEHYLARVYAILDSTIPKVMERDPFGFVLRTDVDPNPHPEKFSEGVRSTSGRVWEFFQPHFRAGHLEPQGKQSRALTRDSR